MFRTIFIFFCHLIFACALLCDAGGGSSVNCTNEKLCYRDDKYSGCSRSQTECPDATQPCTKEFCCCDTDNCNIIPDSSTNDGILTPSASESSSNALMIGVVIFVVLAAIGIGVVIYIFCIRGNKEKYAKLEENANKQPNSDGVVEDPSNDSMIIQTDRTNYVIPDSLTEAEKAEILNSINKDTMLPGQPAFYKTPCLVQVITVSASDNITMMEELVTLSTVSPTATGREVCATILNNLVQSGAQQYPFQAADLKRVLVAAEEVIRKEPTLVEVFVPCVIYGDIHGQYSDLIRWFNLNGWPNKTRSVFLGDFVDRGSHGVEVVALMSCLKVLFPKNIFICRGNHEEEGLNKAYSFFDEVRMRFDEPNNTEGGVYTHFKNLFNSLPLAALVGEKILGMHGGLSPKLNSLQDIRDIVRPIEEFKVGTLACDLVWSDPDISGLNPEFRPNLDREPQFGIGQLFSSAAVQSACQRLNVDLIIRGHQAPLSGYAKWAGGRMFTLFSAPGYKGRFNNVNMGACISCANDGKLTVKQIRVSEEFRRKRVDDINRRKMTATEKYGPKDPTPSAMNSPWRSLSHSLSSSSKEKK